MVDLGQIETTDDPAIAHKIECRLLASLARMNRQAPTQRKTFCLSDHHGQLIAGLTCATAYGWLHIETLWVEEAVRARGVGRRLMTSAETFGRQHGCHSVWLDTSNAEARVFYEKLGYCVFGELANGEKRFPPEHKRWFLKRALCHR